MEVPWALVVVSVYSLALLGLRGFGRELEGKRWRWVARTCGTLVMVWALEGVLPTVALVGGIAVTYVENVLGPAPKTERAPFLGTVLVTGATSGIGRATAVQLVKAGCVVVVPGRDATKAKKVADDINVETTGTGLALAVPDADLELSSQESVRRYAAALQGHLKAIQAKPLSTLVLNAGVMLPSPETTSDGAEMTIAANHLGHHTLTMALLDDLEKASVDTFDARIVVITSSLHHMAARELLLDSSSKWSVLGDFGVPPRYELFQAYSRSKLVNILWAEELARRLDDERKKIAVLAVHPGLVMTQVTRSFPLALRVTHTLMLPIMLLLQKTPAIGARTPVHACLAPDFLPSRLVVYLDNCTPTFCATASSPVLAMNAAKHLWDATVQYANKCR